MRSNHRAPRPRHRGWVLAAALATLAAGCNRSESPTISATGSPSPTAPSPTVSISSPADGTEVGGNVVTLTVLAKGMEIKPADGDRSGTTGHFHVFVDKDPVAEGQVIPVETGVIHSATNPIVLTGLTVGKHKLTVVLGNGAHERVGKSAPSITVNVKGPSVQASAPATVKSGDPVVVTMKAEGIQIRPADGDKSGKSGHFHLYIDPDAPPASDGHVIPKVEGKIIHTSDPSYAVKGLSAGQHTIWVVVGDGLHIPLNPLVAAKLTVTVQ